MAVEQQRAERQRFGGRPVDALAGLDRLAAGIEEALDGAVDVEALRHRGDLLADLLQRLERRRRCRRGADRPVARGLEPGPAAVEPVGLVRLVALARLELDIEPRAPVGLHLLDFALGDDTLGDQLLGVDFQRRRCDLIALYISGWVNAGSSPSLWPKRR